MGALIAGVLGVASGAGSFAVVRTQLTDLKKKQADDHTALEARVEKVEQLAQAVNALGQKLSQSIEHLGERFATEMKHMAERQADHNTTISQQLTEIREEQRSFARPRTPPRRQS